MAYKITATLTVRKGAAESAALSTETDQVAAQVHRYLEAVAAQAGIDPEGLTVTVEDVKRDGSFKFDGQENASYTRA